LIQKGRRAFAEKVPYVFPVEGVPDAIQQLKREGYTLGVLTSNAEENVRQFLASHKMDVFDFIYSESSILGKKKLLQRMLREKHLDRGHVIYVGDEIRDIDAAKKAGIRVIAVTWGFNTEEALRENSPDYIAKHPQDLCAIATALG
jgi:phosphoglycolate phosphatase